MISAQARKIFLQGIATVAAMVLGAAGLLVTTSATVAAASTPIVCGVGGTQGTADVSGGVATVTLSSNCQSFGQYFYFTSYEPPVGAVTCVNNSVPGCGQSPNDYPQSLYAYQMVPNTTLTISIPVPACYQLDVLVSSTNSWAPPNGITYSMRNSWYGPTTPEWGAVGGNCGQRSLQPETLGYWKHWNTCTVGQSSVAGNPLMGSYLPQLLGNYEVQNCTEGVAVLSNTSAKYAENQLAAQLLAAELNLTAGATSCQAADNAVAQANQLLASINYSGPPSSVVGPQSPQRQEFLSVASTLDSYNSGTLC